MSCNIKVTLENFGTVKIAHVSHGQAVLLGNELFVKVVRTTKGETCSLVKVDTGRIETVSQHLLCVEVELDVNVRIKKQPHSQKLYSESTL